MTADDEPGTPPAGPGAGALERWFSLKERGTTARTEVLAGVTTFLTMAYIVLVNPAILGTAGMPVASVAAATCFAAAFASILMGFVANTPLALAPGMGLNAYFSFTVVQQMGVPWPVALGCVFISGVAFLVLTVTGVRQLIVASIPQYLFAAVAGGIGLFIGFIGFKDAGIVVANPATFVALGDLKAPGAALALMGLAVIGALSVWNVRGAMLIGILATSVVGWLCGMVSVSPEPYSLEALTGTAFKLDLAGVFGLSGSHGLGLLEILFVFLFVDLFDNIGTLVAVTKRAGLMDENGRIPRLNRILITDATATIVGSMAGTSTVTSYVESAAGVQEGGRTGLTAVVTGLLFLATMFVAPYAQLIPLAATAPALIIVGGLMLLPLTEVEWEDPLAAIPAFLTVAMIPLTFSIANGLAFGITAHAGLKIVRGTIEKKDWFLLVLALLFIARFVWMGAA
ncbi:NCS2 family permease [Novosphingobium aerophilum]|uniref:NCS2 family permease n=1 Tax=Novosphingobium TaxID=165696 RepID=UPI0006C8D0B2|nr:MULTISPECIES: NCS2 family permease [unclassified Novosphingobium]KPH60266.1 guanine permease [Novosphingobium sp. ST904]MPS68556.1 NCS2 family permease [Novosphingobium sp.]TCM36850.1 AGZA family xanthine/uracil permease-like MFS transporter [Novosphingobium sp. ST904]WRT94599.1 NCS2 family permease [Novosphingobium sp. RL4]